MGRFLPPPGQQQNQTANLRYLVFFEIRKHFENDEKTQILKPYRMCRFLPPPRRQEKWAGNLRYLVFFDIRNKKNQKDEKNSGKYCK